MRKLITLSVLSVLLLTGCGSDQAQTVPQPVEQEDEDEMGWFADEVLDMDDWGEKKKHKTKTEVVKPLSPKPSVDTKSTTKPKVSTSKKNPKGR